jgi:hypothetical protein
VDAKTWMLPQVYPLLGIGCALPYVRATGELFPVARVCSCYKFMVLYICGALSTDRVSEWHLSIR